MKGKRERLWLFSLLVMGVLLIANQNFALAQVTASMLGKIEDPSGAAVPSATVAVTNQETGVSRTVTTDEAGKYRVLSLPVGRYEIRSEKTGFKSAVQKGITLVVGQEAVVNLKLEVGAMQQQVTVTAEVPVVNTTTASVSGLVGEKQVKDLPLNGRSFDNLITLNAGTVNLTAMKGTGVTTQMGNIFSVAGRRPSENLFLLNGVEYTGPNQTHTLPGGVSGQLLGIDAVREFNVVSDAYSAEYGKRAGGQVIIVTQSGTNALHGTAFEFLRNSDLDARNFFDHGTIPPFKRNQFGGAAGGPIQKDKTFIFGNYEGFRQRLGISAVAIVPDNNARQGLLPNAQGVPTPVLGLNPAILPYMAFWPTPNGPNLGGGLALAYSNPAQMIREDFGTVRFDRNFSDKDLFSSIYTVDDGYNLTPNADPLFGLILQMRNQLLSVQETHIFSPNVINLFTAAVSRIGFSPANPPIGAFPSNLSFVQGKMPGNLIVGGGTGVGASTVTAAGSSLGYPWFDGKTLFTYQDGLQVIRGKHQISLGVWFERLRSNEAGGGNRGLGQASFGNLQSFLQGIVGTFTVIPNSTPYSWRQLEGAWYVQDAIQVRPNLTVRLGLRHEFTNGWNDANGRAANFIYDSNGALLTNTMVGHSVYTENNSKWLFGPRVGLAWDPFGKGKTSIRAGFGTYYSLLDSLGFLLEALPPFNGISTFTNVPLLSLVPVVPGVPVPPTCGPAVPKPCTTYSPQGVQPTLKTPTAEEWTLGIEQQITPNTSLRVSYAGSQGYHGSVTIDTNSIHSQICSDPAGCTSGGIGSARGTVPQGAEYIPVGTRLNPYLANGYFLFSESNSSYHALRVELMRRFSQGLLFRGNYTWSKDLDISTGIQTADAINENQMIMNPYQLRRDWGRAAQDLRHQFSFSGGYELPLGPGKPWLSGASGAAGKLAGGWQLNWVVTVLSGLPVTPQIGSNWSGNGDSRNPDRPSVNPAFSGPVIIGSPTRWFNPNAYVLPTPGTWGNLGRGVLTGPGLGTVDFSLFKTTQISERIGLQFRAEFFNILNHANFGTPNGIVFSGAGVSPSAGVITATTTTSRQIQFGLKLNF